MTLFRYQNVPDVEKCSIPNTKADSCIIKKDVGVYQRFSIIKILSRKRESIRFELDLHHFRPLKPLAFPRIPRRLRAIVAVSFGRISTRNSFAHHDASLSHDE